MDDKKQLFPHILAVVAIVIFAGVSLWQGKSQVTVSVAPAGSPVTVSPSSATSPSSPVVVSEQNDGPKLGATPTDQITSWPGGASFGGDVTIGGVLLNSLGSYGTFHTSSTMVTATTTPCALQNTSGRTRTILDIGYLFPATEAVGAINIAAGTSSSAYVSSTSQLVNSVLTRSASTDVISTTSTVMTAYAPWKANEWLVFWTNTTTNVGTCRALYY